MRAVVMREFGPPSVLRLEEVPVPEVRPTDVLIKVGAVGVAYHDIVQRNGTMRRFTDLPFILGYEIAGTVAEVGSLVRTVAVGDQVCTKAFHSCGLCRLCRNGMETACAEREAVHGGYAEFVAVAEEACVRVPDDIPPAVACMLGATTGVALNAVRDTARVRLGESVLVTGAGGGVGIAAVELARLAGANVIGLTRSSEKKAAIVAAGAAEVVVIGEGDFSPDVKSLTRGRGVDVVIDTVGSRVFTSSFKSLAVGGRYAMVGQLLREEVSINPAFIFFQRAQILGVGSVRRDQLADVVELAVAGRIRPRVAAVYSLEEAALAHAVVEAGTAVGRVVLSPLISLTNVRRPTSAI